MPLILPASADDLDKVVLRPPSARNWKGSLVLEQANTQWIQLPFRAEDYPLTMGCWFRDPVGTGTDNDRTLIQLANPLSNSMYVRLSRYDLNANANNIEAFSNASGAGDSAWTTNVYGNDEWSFGAGWFISNGLRRCKLGTGNTATNFVNSPLDWSSMDELAIGYENDSTPGDPWEGNICHLWLYRGDLREELYFLLLNGARPDQVMEWENLFYMPLVDSLEILGGWNSKANPVFKSTSGTPKFSSDTPPVSQTTFSLALQPQHIELPEPANGFHLPDVRMEAPELLLPFRKPKTNDSQINWEDGLTEGLIFCCLCDEEFPVNLVDKRRFVFQSGAPNTAPILGAGRRGQMLSSTADGAFGAFITIDYTAGPLPVGDGLTIAALAKPVDSATDYATVVGLLRSGAGNGMQVMAPVTAASDDVGAWSQGMTAVWQWGNRDVLWDEYALYVWKLSNNRADSKLWVNGVDYGAPSAGDINGIWDSDVTEVCLLSSSEWNDERFSGDVSAVWVWGNLIPDSKVLKFSKDPNQFLIPDGS